MIPIMTLETFVLSPCTPEDVESMISVYESAFAHDYLSSFTFPTSTITPDSKRNWLRTRFLGTLSKPELRTFKIVETDTGRMAAWARWGFPYSLDGERLGEEGAEKDFDPAEWPEGSNLEVCEAKFGGQHKKRKSLCTGNETYICYLLCTDPVFQRKGLARKLLQHVIDLADAEGRKTYIEATQDGHPVYLKLGFMDIDVLTIDLSKWGGKELGVSRIMIRDPKPFSGSV